ncbi:MAG: hypothetical protein JST00_43170 [Deltaproteobacteria bacterium]|nr:hypothetical protein [Deltaproteobacteria bacterium]
MSLRSFVALGSVAVGLVLAGCSSEAAPAEKESVESYENELRQADVRYLGTITNGQTRTHQYSYPPVYRAYGFSARGGDEITLEVKSTNGGDAMGWITSSNYQTHYAANDDASSSTLDSKVVYKVPAGTTSREYRAVFRDYDLLNASFSVKLTIKSAVAPTCNYNGSTYAEGASFPSTDGCNTCTCGTNGAVGCTKRACVCNPETETNRRYIGTPTSCQFIRFACNADEQYFSNNCGCGCEKL